MYRLIYPRKTQALFTNRATELEILESYKNRLLQGEANKIAFIGTRRIGKSTILYEFIKRHDSERQSILVYVNLQRLVMEPHSFAKSYLGLVTKWAIKDTADNFSRYEDPEFCMLQLQKLHPRAAEYLYQFIRSSQNREASLKSLVEQAFNFPKILSECLNRPIILMIDEFQEITLLNNFAAFGQRKVNLEFSPALSLRRRARASPRQHHPAWYPQSIGKRCSAYDY
jgi:AAA+ ATPase superfamily predicted ATPase